MSLLLKYMSKLLELAGEEIAIEMPEPTAMMTLGEYKETLVQIGILIAVLIGMGAIAQKRERGTVAMILSKPVSRGAFVVAKLVAMSTSFIIALGVRLAAYYIYTFLLIKPANVSAFLGLNVLLSLFFNALPLGNTAFFKYFQESARCQGYRPSCFSWTSSPDSGFLDWRLYSG